MITGIQRAVRGNKVLVFSLLVKDVVVDFVEEPWATSNSYQVQTGHRHRQREKRMLIGISIRSVTSKRSCALDVSPSCKRIENKL